MCAVWIGFFTVCFTKREKKGERERDRVKCDTSKKTNNDTKKIFLNYNWKLLKTLENQQTTEVPNQVFNLFYNARIAQFR